MGNREVEVLPSTKHTEMHSRTTRGHACMQQLLLSVMQDFFPTFFFCKQAYYVLGQKVGLRGDPR